MTNDTLDNALKNLKPIEKQITLPSGERVAIVASNLVSPSHIQDQSKIIKSAPKIDMPSNEDEDGNPNA